MFHAEWEFSKRHVRKVTKKMRALYKLYEHPVPLYWNRKTPVIILKIVQHERHFSVYQVFLWWAFHENRGSLYTRRICSLNIPDNIPQNIHK
jgi:hypothetical protein